MLFFMPSLFVGIVDAEIFRNKAPGVLCLIVATKKHLISKRMNAMCKKLFH